MLLRTFRFQAQLASLVDAILVAGTLLAALVTHKLLAWLFPGRFAIFDMFWSNSWIYVLVVPVWSFMLDFAGVYTQFVGLSPWNVFRRAAKGGLLSFAVLLGLLYALRLHMVPRTILGIHCIYSIAAIALRAIYLQPIMLRSEPRRRLLLAGSPAQAAAICDWLRDPARADFFEVAGFLGRVAAGEHDRHGRALRAHVGQHRSPLDAGQGQVADDLPAVALKILRQPVEPPCQRPGGQIHGRPGGTGWG